MTQAEFIAEVYGVAWESNPNLNSSSIHEEILEELRAMKDKAMRWEIIISSFKPEPELFPITNSILNKERRQGQL